MATIETLEAEINKLKADVQTTISKVEAETTPKAAEAAVAKSREGEVKTISPTEKKDEVKTAITKADEPVATAKPKEAEVKVVVPAENKNEVKTIKADEPVATAKPKEAEVKTIGPTQNRAKDAVEKVKTGAVYIGKAKFWAAVCLAFLFGVAVGSFIGTYATRSSLGRAAASVGVSPSSAGRP
jgi:hypothetical protein